MASVFGVVGGVLVAGGLALVIASPNERGPVAGHARPGPPRVAVTPLLGGAELTWRFE